MELLLLIVGLVLFVALVVVHEFGHFVMARRNGVEVEEFGIGFPPKALTIGHDKKGTEYTLNWLPLGGFVRLKGEHDSDKQKGAFGAANFWAKTKIMLAGVFMNLVTAWLVFTFLALVGIPKLPLPDGSDQFTVKSDTKVLSNKVLVGYVEPNGPADKAGLKTGDQITDIYLHGYCPQCLNVETEEEVARHQIASTQDLRDTAAQGQGKRVTVAYVRKGAFADIKVDMRGYDEVQQSLNTDSPKGYLGIQPYDYTIQRSTWSAPIVGAGLIKQYSSLTYRALGGSVANIFRGHAKEASENVAGPIGIFVVLKDGATFGLSYILLIIALLSLTLAIMNTLPIPALDGGKLFVMLLFRLINKPLTQKLEERIHGTGFAVLMALFVLITAVDIGRFF